MQRLVVRQCIRSVTNSLRFRSLQTTTEAAAGVSYVRGLFLGYNNTDLVFPYPKIEEQEKETLQLLVSSVAKYFETIDTKSIDKNKKIPQKVMNELKELGLFGLQIDEELNGLGLSNTGYARVCEEFSDASIAVTIMAHQSIGLKGILLHGNAEQKQKYLPKLATGENLAAFALTEPSSGSDAASIRTRATLSEDGKHYILNGSKIWISNGGWANIMTVFAKTLVDGHDKVTAFIVERDFGGVTSGPPEDKLGIRGSNTCALYFENCPVPIENILGGGIDMKTGGIAGIGHGFKVAMNILNNGRFGLGACAGASLRRIFSTVAKHANSRVQFNEPIANFQLIQKKFAQMALHVFAIESMVYLTTGMIDRGNVSCDLEAAMCKVYGSEAAFEGINECIQVMGGTGFMKDGAVEQLMRDCRILSIFEGTNEILRLLIALSGVRTAGDRLKQVRKAFKSPFTNILHVQREIAGRLQQKFTPRALTNVHSELEEEGVLLQKRTREMGEMVELLLRLHGKDIIKEQLQLERIADAAILLYAMTATISKTSSSLNASIECGAHEKRMTKVYCATASERVKDLLSAVEKAVHTDKARLEIAKEVLGQERYIPNHPTDVNV